MTMFTAWPSHSRQCYGDFASVQLLSFSEKPVIDYDQSIINYEQSVIDYKQSVINYEQSVIDYD